MATTTPSPSTHKRPSFSCIRCAERKVKCNRQKPCSACVKHSVDCVFNPVPPSTKRNKRVKVNVLTERLRQYEALLEEQGVDPRRLLDQAINRSQPVTYAVPDRQEQHDHQLQTPSFLKSELSPHGVQTFTVPGQLSFNFVENSLWNRVVEEVSRIPNHMLSWRSYHRVDANEYLVS
jgi:hypothetical protein